MIASLLPFCAGFALSASLIVAIGAQNLFVLRQGLKKEHVGMIVLFCGVSDAILIVAGVSGMGVFLTTVPQLSKGFALAGTLFLAWYGIKSLRQVKNPDSMTVTRGQAVPLQKALTAVAAFTWLNPHVYLDTVLLWARPQPHNPLRYGLFLRLALHLPVFFGLLHWDTEHACSNPFLPDHEHGRYWTCLLGASCFFLPFFYYGKASCIHFKVKRQY